MAEIMKTGFINYNFEKSLNRIDSILNSSDNNYEEKGNNIPPRKNLTHTNGFYVDVSAIFVDIRDSSSLSNNHRRPILAKIYRSFISEIVAIMNGNETCHEINIIGDCVSGVFETPTKENKEELVRTLAELNGIIHVLNCKLSKKNIQNIKVGIGADIGRALMIKAGYKGSTIDEIVWMGDVVNNASNLCNMANKKIRIPILISNELYKKLPSNNKSYFVICGNDIYGSDFVTEEMNNWWKENCNED